MKIGEYEQMMAYLTRSGGRANFGDGSSEVVEIDFSSKEDQAFQDMMKAYKYYLSTGGTKSLKDYMRMSTGAGKYRAGGREHFRATGGRVNLADGTEEIAEPPKSMQVDTTTKNPIPDYDITDFRNDAELYVLMLHNNTIPMADIASKLNSFAQKGIDAGTFTMQEAADTVKDLKLYIKDRARQQRLRDIIPSGIGTIKREEFSKGGLAEYLSTLKPGSVINTYELGKKFKVAPATVRGQVERNFPELKLQTIEEGAAKAKETRRAQYAEKTSDVPIIQSEVKGKGAEARTKGRNIIGVKFPNEELENKYIKYMEDRYSDVKGRKGPSNKELATEFYGDASTANVAKIEKINQFYKKNLDLRFKKAPPDEVKEKRTRRLAITQGGKTFTGTDKIPFHHIMPIGGEVDLTTKDVAFINKQMNSKLAPYNTKLNDIADAISNQLNNQEPGYLKRIDELNKQAEQIIESVKTRLPKKFQNYIGFNRLDPILDEYGTPIRMNVTRVGVDDSKSLAGKRGEAVKLETLTQKKLLDKIKKSGKVGAAGVVAAAVPSTFALADDKLAGEQPVEGTGEGLPYEAALPGSVILGRYGPQVLNLLKNIGVKPFGSVTAGLGFTASELASEDPSYGLAGAEMLLPEVTGAASKAAGIKSKIGKFLLNPFTAISPAAATVVPKIMTRVGVPVMIGGGIMDIAKASEPDFLLDKETGEPMAFDREDASFVMPTMIDANEQVSRLAKEKGISYQDAFQELFKDKTFREGIQETVQKYAIGGRVGFADGPEDPSKRKFMKIMGGLASLPIVGRFFDVAQVAEKAAPAAVETIKNAPQHFIGLVNKIRALGKVVDPKNLMPSEQKRFSNVYDYGDYRMFESKDGQIEISKENLMATDYGDGIVSEEYMSYNPKTPKINKKGEIVPNEYEDQYDEYTAYADEDGKMKDVQDGIEESTKDDGIYSKEELEQLIVEQIENDLKKGKK